MVDTIELTVVFKLNLIRRQLFCLNQNHLVNNQSTYDLLKPLKVSANLVQTIYMDRKLGSCVDYRRRVATTLCRQIAIKYQTSDAMDGHNDTVVNTGASHVICLLVSLQTMDHYLVIDRIWSRCLLSLVSLRFRVEEGFSWLSTLGGAYSSLGEYNVKCAVKAGEISKSQLMLACITGDANIIAKCGIFMAYSLCQQNKKREAIRLIRRTLYMFIRRIQFCDPTVKAMYSALCYRIKHFY